MSWSSFTSMSSTWKEEWRKITTTTTKSTKIIMTTNAVVSKHYNSLETHGCHQQHATLHDTSRTHIDIYIYICLGHGHQKSSSNQTYLSPLYSVYILKNFLLNTIQTLSYCMLIILSTRNYVGSQTVLNPTVSSTNLLTVLLRQCCPILGTYHTSSK